MSVHGMIALADVLAIFAYGVAKRVLKPKVLQAASGVAGVLYLLAFLCLMVFSRTPLAEPRWHLIPFQAYEFANVFYREFVFGILVFIPVGLLLCGLFPGWRAINIILVGIGLSLGIELIQFLAHVGVSDINDIVANMVGCALAVWVGQMLGRLPKTAGRQWGKAGFWVLGLLCVAILLLFAGAVWGW